MNNDAEHFYICLLTIHRSFIFVKRLSISPINFYFILLVEWIKTYFLGNEL